MSKSRREAHLAQRNERFHLIEERLLISFMRPTFLSCHTISHQAAAAWLFDYFTRMLSILPLITPLRSALASI